MLLLGLDRIVTERHVILFHPRGNHFLQVKKNIRYQVVQENLKRTIINLVAFLKLNLPLDYDKVNNYQKTQLLLNKKCFNNQTKSRHY